MDVDLTFPVIGFHSKFASLCRTWDCLTITTMVGLKKGMFNNLLIVDYTGKAIWVNGARKICGVGQFRGYNIFLNQRIKVEMLLKGEPFQMSIEEIKERIFKSFKEWEGWSANINFEVLKAKVESATTIAEVYDAIFSA